VGVDDASVGSSPHRRPFPASALAYRLAFRCYRSLSLLSRDRTRHWFLNSLKLARGRYGFALRAYVLLPDGARVLLVPHDPAALDEICRAIKLPVSRRARAFLTANHPDRLEQLKVTRPSGNVEFRFWDTTAPEDRAVVLPAAYPRAIESIHEEPVQRGLASSAVDYPWSSARWYAGRGEAAIAMDGVGA
jgi:putative transposase